MPNAPAKGGDVNFFGVFWVRNYAMPPFEVKTRYSRPDLTAVVRFPCRGLKPGSVEYFRVARVYGDIVDVAIAIKYLPPSPSCIYRQVDPATVPVLSFVPRPRREIESIRLAGINRQAVRSIASLGHRYPTPVFRPIGGLVNRSVRLCSYASVLRTARQQDVKSPSAVSHNSPGKRFILGDSSVFQLPALAPVCALVYPAAEGGNVEHACGGQTRRVQKDMRRRGFLHPEIGRAHV